MVNLGFSAGPQRPIRSQREVQATSPKPGFNFTVHDAIPAPLGKNCAGMTQLRSVFAVSEVKNA
jgi:hypothetical protein